MSKRKLTDAEVEAMMRDYYAWEKYNPESETAEELAARHGVSKQTLYKEKREYERKHGFDARSRLLATPSSDGREGLEGVVQWLTEELVAARVRIRELEQQLEAAQNDRPLQSH